MIQDIFPSTFDNQYRPGAKPGANAFVAHFVGRDLLCRVDENQLKFPRRRQFPHGDEAFTYLFSINGDEFYLLGDDEQQTLDGWSYRDISLFNSEKPREMAFAAVTAWHLHGWYRDSQYCGRCGTKAVHDDKERMMHCPKCGNMIFPRVMPTVIVGVINGAIIVRFKVPPMIMTLGMMYIARGIVYIITDGVTVYPLPDSFNALEQSDILGFPSVVPFSILLAIIFNFMFRRTEFGRSVYAIGGNPDTAKLSGISIKKITMYVYMICGCMAGLTGLVYASRLGSAQPGSGDGYEMNVIAACIIGGTSTFGGRGTILGTILGALFMSMLSNSMTLMKIDVNYHKLVIGAVLVFAVVLDQYKRELAEKRATSLK